jgi:hypothetical protein
VKLHEYQLEDSRGMTVSHFGWADSTGRRAAKKWNEVGPISFDDLVCAGE